MSLSACTHTITRSGLLADMDGRIAKKGSHINILWYRGTSGNYHYLSHVYAMFGSRDYRVLETELAVPAGEIIPLSSDSTKWKRIAAIGDQWRASRERNGMWVRESEGLKIDD